MLDGSGRRRHRDERDGSPDRCYSDHREDAIAGPDRPWPFGIGLRVGFIADVVGILRGVTAIQRLEQVVEPTSGVLPQHVAMVQALERVSCLGHVPRRPAT